MRNSSTRLGNLALSLATALLGIYAGAQLTEGALLVPYWRSLPASEFLAWYAANDARLLRFFGPLTTATVLGSLAAAAMAAWTRHPGRWPAATAAGLTTVALAMFFVYFERTNASFAAATISPADVPAELARWATWHWTRVVVSLAALAAAILSVWRATAD